MGALEAAGAAALAVYWILRKLLDGRTTLKI
jgi:hypothetical protein